jgi:hypothetical protein
MKIRAADGLPITSLVEWEQRGGPVSPDQWKAGRSAYELAADWIDRDADRRVSDLLHTIDAFDGIQLIDGVAEKETQFDDNTRGPRHHDLLVRAAVPTGSVTIGVEGKADESFGDPVWLNREKGLRGSPNTGALARTDQLSRLWFGTSVARDRGRPSVACLMYQLLSALAGTLADAKAHGSPGAVLLIHEFVTDVTRNEEHARNAVALDDFLSRLLGNKQHRVSGPGGWVTESVAIPGDGEWMAETTSVSFAKLVVNRRATDDSH